MAFSNICHDRYGSASYLVFQSVILRETTFTAYSVNPKGDIVCLLPRLNFLKFAKLRHIRLEKTICFDSVTF